MMSEPEIAKHLYSIIAEGKDNRRTGKHNKYPGNSLYHMLSSTGWVYEDLRIALMKSNPQYEKGQAQHGNGLQSIKESNR